MVVMVRLGQLQSCGCAAAGAAGCVRVATHRSCLAAVLKLGGAERQFATRKDAKSEKVKAVPL